MKVDYIGYALAVISLIYAYYLYRKGLRAKEPVYSIKSNNLISGSVSTLENLIVSYKKHKIENLTVSKILFYNRGSETISQQDIQTINPLRVSSETCSILDASILQVNNPSNNITVSLNEPSEYIYINFDYLDKDQGAVIQVIHDGSSSIDIGLHGDIIGVQKLDKLNAESLQSAIAPKRADRLVNILAMLGFFAGIVLLGFIIPVFTSPSDFESIKNDEPTFYSFWFTLGWIGTVIVISGNRLFSQFRGGRKIPLGLEKFLD